LEDGEDIRAGLEGIKNGEAEAWLKKREEKHKCPKCGRPLPVGRMKRKCYHCSADLSKNTEEA
jgi:ribosomal protein L37AE/L43A